MGEAKRRKKLDDLYGKVPSSVPQDYLRHKGFRPCFGYVYMVKFKDSEPCLFSVKKSFIILSMKSNTFSLVLDSLGIASVEMKNQEIERRFYEILPQSEVINFVAYPNYSEKYTDNHGLAVIPFNIKFFVDDINLIETNRRFFIGYV